jgi:uncharacterized YccA/Bax inhibitor family protein
MLLQSRNFTTRGMGLKQLPIQPQRQMKLSRRRKAATVHAVLSSRTSNPAFTMGRVDEAIYETGRGREIMTLDGVAMKTSGLMLVALAAAAYQWMQIFSGSSALAMAAMSLSKVAGIVGIGTGFLTMFKPNWSPITGPIYALAKGLAVGGMAALMELRYPGMIMSAVSLTFATAASLGISFQTGLINVNDKFRSGVTMVTGGFVLVMGLSFLLSFVGISLPFLSGGPIGIGVGLVSAGLASANLLVDFDMIRSVQRQRVPQWFEWYASFSLMVTLVWMFTSILRLLGLMSGSRDD